nr:SpvB/TcaC N-terminal domain-containing protein [Vibrio coralliilyticus]
MRRFAIFICTLFYSITVFSSESGVSSNVISLPSGPGTIQGLGEGFKTRLNTGSSTDTLSIQLPKGRNDYSPKLSIQYDSGYGNGILGVGRKLSLPFIQRKTTDGLPSYIDGNDYFVNNDGEDLVAISKDEYRAEIEGKFLRYVKFGNEWNVYLPDGSLWKFGKELDSTISSGEKTFRWYIESMRDANGNLVEFKYTKLDETTAVYLESISYNDGISKVLFEYEIRPDILLSYRSTFSVETRFRIENISTFNYGEKVFSYEFKYDSITDWNSLSRLVKVRKNAGDGSIYGPPTSYTYTSFSIDNPVTKYVPSAKTIPLSSPNTDFIDINADGLPDVINTGASKHTYWLNQGLGDNQDVSFSPMERMGTYTRLKLSDKRVKWADVDGNGRVDILTLTSVSGQSYSLNTSHSWEVSARYGRTGINADSDSAKIVDLNNDRLPDIFSTNSSSSGTVHSHTISVNNGNGWDIATTMQMPFGSEGVKLGSPDTFLADINGDNLSDLIHIGRTKMTYFPGKGVNGFGEAINVADFSAIGKQLFDTRSLRLSDVNHDGMVDLIYLNGKTVTLWPNTGYSDDSSEWTYGKGQTIEHDGGFAPTVVKFADIDGDSVSDIVWYRPGKRDKSFSYISLANGVQANLLASIDNGIGLITNISYEPSSSQMKKEEMRGSPWKVVSPISIPVVNSTITIDKSRPKKHQANTLYRYYDSFYSPGERRFTGFLKTKVIEPSTPNTQGLITKYEFLSGKEKKSLRGKAVSITVSSPDNKVYSQEKFDWDTKTLFSDTFDGRQVTYSHLSKLEKQVIEKGTKEPVTLVWDYEYDNYGNQTREMFWGRLDNKFVDEKETLRTFSSSNSESVDNWQLNRLTEEIVQDGSKKVLSKQQWLFDDETHALSNLGRVTNGNLTSHVQWVNPAYSSERIYTSRYKHDQYGNTIQILDPLYGIEPGHYRSIRFKDGLYPVSEVIQLGGIGLSVSAGFDMTHGVVSRYTDFNQNTTFYEYDGLGRLISVVKPNDSTSMPTRSFKYGYQSEFEDSHVNWIETEQRIEAGGVAKRSRSYFGGSGELLMKVEESEDGFRVNKRNVYDARGNVVQEYLPYFSSSLSFHTWEHQDPIESSFDGLNRLLTQSFPATATQSSTYTSRTYYPLALWVQDTAQTLSGGKHSGAGKHMYFDGLGKLRLISEIVGVDESGERGGLQEWNTQYDFDGLGNFTRLIDAYGNERHMVYDGLNREVYASDPNRGEIWRRYNSASKLITEVDSRGVKRLYQYDGANRISAKYYRASEVVPSSPYEELSFDLMGAKEIAQYRYDSDGGRKANLLGRLSSVSNESGSVAYGYDTNGNRNYIAKEVKAFGTTSNIHVMQKEFNSAGQIVKEIFPDDTFLSYVFGKGGELIKLGGVASQLTYSASGKITSMKLDNGTTRSFAYDNLDRLIETETWRDEDSVYLQSLHYEYDEASNITFIEDQRTQSEKSIIAKELGEASRWKMLDQTQSIEYDDWYRIYSNRNVTSSRQYRFDPIGNLIQLSESKQATGSNVVRNMLYGGEASEIPGVHSDSNKRSGPNALTQAGNQKYSYDAIGNRISSGDHTLEWDHSSRMISATSSSMSAKYAYDHHNQRTAKKFTDSSGKEHIVFYLFPNVEIRDGRIYKYARIENQRIAVSTQASGTFSADKYFIKQHQHSTELTLDQNGGVLSALSYRPFGKVSAELGRGSEVHYRYSDKERDSETGLGYFEQRYLNTSHGQFITPDPVFYHSDRFTDPQQWSPYAYARGNPIMYHDPEGEFIVHLGAVALGAAIGGTVNVAMDMLAGKEFSWNSFATGAIAGGVGAIGFGSGAAAKMLSGCISGVAADTVIKKGLVLESAATACAIGVTVGPSSSKAVKKMWDSSKPFGQFSQGSVPNNLQGRVATGMVPKQDPHTVAKEVAMSTTLSTTLSAMVASGNNETSDNNGTGSGGDKNDNRVRGHSTSNSNGVENVQNDVTESSVNKSEE